MAGPRNIGEVPQHGAILVRLQADDYASVAELADSDGTSLGGWVRTLVKRHLRQEAAA